MDTEFESQQGQARIVGSAGSAARSWGVWQLLAPSLLLVLVIGIVLGAAWRPVWLERGGAAVVLLGLLFGLAGLLRWGIRRLTDHLNGAHGEELTAYALAGLSGEWTVYHAVPLQQDGRGGRDVDHVAISSSAVVLVETTFWPGLLQVQGDRILVDGHPLPTDPVTRTLAKADALQSLIKELAGVRVDVHPVLCMTGGTLLEAQAPRGVEVVDVRRLQASLRAVDSSGQEALLRKVLRALDDYMAANR